MKQTAVEFLVEQIRLTNIEGLVFQLWDAIQQAKEMEKTQIFNALEEFVDTTIPEIVKEDYYNETFKKE